MQVLASQLHFLANKNAELAIPPLFWPVNCIKIGGHVALLSDSTVYSLYCAYRLIEIILIASHCWFQASRVLLKYQNLKYSFFYCTIMQWMWVGVNLGCINAYAALEWANDIDMKLHVFATKHKAITYHENLTWWLCPDLELTPTEIYDVTWNPRILSSKDHPNTLVLLFNLLNMTKYNNFLSNIIHHKCPNFASFELFVNSWNSSLYPANQYSVRYSLVCFSL